MTQVIEAEVPGELTSCAARPKDPSPPITDKKVGRFIVELLSAHDDCFGKNRKIGELFGPGKYLGP